MSAWTIRYKDVFKEIQKLLQPLQTLLCGTLHESNDLSSQY